MYGENLKSLRKQKKLTQDDVANILGITRQAYSNYETEKREPDYSTLQKLADIFSVTPDRILGEKEQNHKIDILVFVDRLNQEIKKKELSVQQIAKECNVTQEYIQELITSPKRLPGATTLLNLAMLLDVTPDYLGGFTDEPQGYSPLTPKPKDLKLVLEEEEVVFDGAPLSEDDKEMILGVINALNIKAKKMNKRKKGRD